MSKKELSYEEKIELLEEYWEDVDKVDEVSKEELSLYKKTVEELCKENDPFAMKIKGTISMYGNRAFEQNYEVAEKLLTKLMEEEEDSFIPYILGDINYFGLTSDKPNYKKAFYYYSIAGFGDDSSAKQQLAYMFRNGEGVEKNLTISHKMFFDLYDEARYDFLDGDYDINFAELALMLGHSLCDNLDDDDLLGYGYAYEKYLEASLCIKLYEKDNELTEVEETMKNAIENSLEQTFYESIYADEKSMNFETFSRLLDGNNCFGKIFVGEFKKLTDDEMEIKISFEDGSKILLSIPTEKKISFVKSFRVVVKNIKNFECDDEASDDETFELSFNNLSEDYMWRKFGDDVFKINGDAIVEF